MGIDFKALNEAVDIKEVADSIGLKVNARGFCLCPFHGDKNPSMSVKNHRFRCFACGASGDAIDLYGRFCNVDPMTATEAVAKFAGGIEQFQDGNDDFSNNKLSKEELALIIGDEIKASSTMSRKTVVAKSEVALEPDCKNAGGGYFKGEYLVYKNSKNCSMTDVKIRDFELYKDFLVKLTERKIFVFEKLSERVLLLPRPDLTEQDKKALSEVYAKRAKECKKILLKIKSFCAPKGRKG